MTDRNLFVVIWKWFSVSDCHLGNTTSVTFSEGSHIEVASHPRAGLGEVCSFNLSCPGLQSCCSAAGLAP